MIEMAFLAKTCIPLLKRQLMLWFCLFLTFRTASENLRFFFYFEFLAIDNLYRCAFVKVCIVSFARFKVCTFFNFLMFDGAMMLVSYCMFVKKCNFFCFLVLFLSLCFIDE